MLRLVEDAEAAIGSLKAGGGVEPDPTYGDRIRAEIAMRKAGGRSETGSRTEWFQWLEDDELPLLMGAWLHHAHIVSGRYEITKQAVVDFHADNDEFELASMAMQPSNLRVTLNRLAVARGAPPA